MIRLSDNELKQREKEASLPLGGDPQVENIVLKEYHDFIKRVSAIKGEKIVGTQEHSWMKDKLMAEFGDKATANFECVIDRFCLLSYPLNDVRTSTTLRQVYLEQEQLMIDLAKIEREEAIELQSEMSSPSRELVVVPDTICSTSTNTVISESNYAIAKAQNQRFLESLKTHNTGDMFS